MHIRATHRDASDNRWRHPAARGRRHRPRPRGLAACSTTRTGPSSRPLQRDGRRPYGAIAEEVGLSEAAVRRRVQQIREAGVMQIVAVTDPLQLGFQRQALVGIRVDGDIRGGRRQLAALDDVDYVVMCAGRSTSWSNWYARTTTTAPPPQRLDPVDPRRAAHRDVHVPEAPKQTYTWGTR